MDQERISSECAGVAARLASRPQMRLAVFVARDAQQRPLMQAVSSLGVAEFERSCPSWTMVGVYDSRTPAEAIGDDVLAVLEAMA